MRPTGDAWDTTLDTSEAEVRVAKMSASLWAPRRTGGDGCLSRTVHTGFASARHLKMIVAIAVEMALHFNVLMVVSHVIYMVAMKFQIITLIGIQMEIAY